MPRSASATTGQGHTVGDVARFAGVTVRTLHHYDDIGLLRPSARSDAGYRLYARADLDRLHAILAYRELGFDLGAIGGMLDGDTDAIVHLERQLASLEQHAQRLEAQRTHLTKILEAHKMGIKLDPQAMLEVFGDHDPSRYAEKAEQRWGDSDAYYESQRRASGYRKEDWVRMRDEMEAIEHRLAEAMTDAVPADGPRAMDAAEAHRDHVQRWFYDCSHAIHVGLADTYVADPRFTAHYEERAAGLAAYVAAAIRANAARAGQPEVPLS
ncbi:MAG: MerR family transcriptional regulator [Trueperaceae bacterium]